MRFPRTLAFRITREIITYSTLGFIAITTVLASQNLVEQLDRLTMVGFGLTDLAAVTWALVLMLASYATPVAFLLGILLAMRRMSVDREILAMRSCGLGQQGFLVPALCLGALVSLLSAYLMISVEHKSRRQMLEVFKNVAARGGILEPGRFRLIGRRLFHVEGRTRDNQFERIMIIDHTDLSRRLRIFSERGSLSFDEADQVLRFQLESGDIHVRPEDHEPERYRKLSFEKLEYSFDVSALLGKSFSPMRPRQVALHELDAVIARAKAGDPLDDLDQRDPVEYALEARRRFALPIAPLLFAMLAVPMGLRVSKSGKAWGVFQCFMIVFSYYALFAAGGYTARAGWLSAGEALWIPNALFAGLGVTLLVRDSRSVPR